MKVVDQKGSQVAVLSVKNFGEPFLFNFTHQKVAEESIVIPGHYVIAIPNGYLRAIRIEPHARELHIYLIKHGSPSTWLLYELGEQSETVLQVDMEHHIEVIKEGHGK